MSRAFSLSLLRATTCPTPRGGYVVPNWSWPDSMASCQAHTGTIVPLSGGRGRGCGAAFHTLFLSFHLQRILPGAGLWLLTVTHSLHLPAVSVSCPCLSPAPHLSQQSSTFPCSIHTYFVLSLCFGWYTTCILSTLFSCKPFISQLTGPFLVS